MAAGAKFQYGKPVYAITVAREPGQLMATNAKPADEGGLVADPAPRHPPWRLMSFDVVAFPKSWPCTPVGDEIMKTVAEYRQFAEWCREMALKISDPKDKHAVELMAQAWD